MVFAMLGCAIARESPVGYVRLRDLVLPLTQGSRHMIALSTDLPRSSVSGAAEWLLDQAAACRRLSGVARTVTGASALIGVAEQFELEAKHAEAVGT